MPNCPVCQSEARKIEVQGERHFVECLRCGPYSLSRTVMASLAGYLGRAADVSTKLSYALYRMTRRERWAMLTSDVVENIIKHTTLPRPLEQLDNLILWIGETQPSVSEGLALTPATVAAIGAADERCAGFICSQAKGVGLVAGIIQEMSSGDYASASLVLTLTGWERFEALQRGRASGSNAFMAMQFGDADLDNIVEEHFKPAVKATGFDLKRLDDGQPAGLIDDRLRVEIRQCQFLIADLTHQNRGAYWEAGYAEGLGKPVIYTCRKDVFEDKTHGTHFDTNHHLTVVWEPGNLPEAMNVLKATIRATLPEEAKLSDS